MILPATIEVVRPTSTSSLTSAADAAAVVAVAGVAVLLALLVVDRVSGVPDRLTGWARWVAAVGAALALGLRVAALLGSGAGFGTALVTRRVVAHAALLALVALLGLVAAPWAGLRHAERRAAEILLGVLAVTAVVLGGPRAGGLDALGPATAAVVASVAVATAAGAALSRRWPTTMRRPSAVVALLLAAALVGWPAAIAPSGYTSFSDDLEVDGHLLQLTVAPAAPGENEVHLYAFDSDGARAVLERATITVDGLSPVQLVDAGIGHVLAFSLALPPGEAWTLTVEADTPARDIPLVATTEVRPDG